MNLFALAGSNVNAHHLLRAAYDDDLDGPELDRELARWAHPDCGDAVAFLWPPLRVAVAQWVAGDNDPLTMPGWQPEELDGEVLGALFPLVFGRHPCPDCLDRCSELDLIRSKDVCRQHNGALRVVA
jgi:hypothetical protein